MFELIVKILIGLLRFLWRYSGAILTATFLAVVFQTQRVIAMMKNVGGDVSFADRLSMTVYDLQHLGSLYIIVIAIGFLVAMLTALLVSWLVQNKMPALSLPIFMTAGAIAMLVMLYGAKAAFFDVHIIAGARDGSGQFLQMVAGAMGGFVFWRLRRNPTARETNAF